MSETDLILGIETSCDETAAAILRGGAEIVAQVVASQDELHAHFGGVVPEVASRRHSEIITGVVAETLERAQIGWQDLVGIAVTHGPGLVGSLLVGVSAAKGYCLSTGLPLIGVNHVEAHLFANFVHRPGEESSGNPDLMPAICLIASGGHSDIVLVEALGQYRLLGSTRDDAAGEAMDKAARTLGLGYPGGPAIDRAAKSGRADAVAFPRPSIDGSFDFSFSGLKTAMVRQVDDLRESGTELDEAITNDLAASFQEAVADTLVRNLTAAAGAHDARQVLLAGGVAANSRLRAKMREWSQQSGAPLAAPPIRLCTDNAAMVAAAGFFRAGAHGWDDLDLDVFSAMPIDGSAGRPKSHLTP